MSSYLYTKLHEEFSENHSFWIAHTEQEIGGIIQTSVFCVDTYDLRSQVRLHM